MTTLMTLRQTQYPSMDDARLAHQARADPEAFAELYRRHVRSVYRYHLAPRRQFHEQRQKLIPERTRRSASQKPPSSCL